MAGIVIVKLLVTLLATLIAYGVYQLSRVIYEEFTLPTRDLPGPKSTNLLFGNIKDVQEDELVFRERWVQEYGTVFRLKGLFSLSCLYIADTKTLSHILMNTSYDYQKAKISRYSLSLLLGPGVLAVEEDEHKLQRKIMNPAFSPGHIREHTEIFVEKAVQLRDIWADESANQGGTGRVDVLPWLSKMTLDVIGLAGFHYKFDALTNQQSELNNTFDALFKNDSKLPVIPLLKAQFPILRFIGGMTRTSFSEAEFTFTRLALKLPTFRGGLRLVERHARIEDTGLSSDPTTTCYISFK